MTIDQCFALLTLLQEVKALPYVKQSLADKIWEIIRTNELVKLSAFQSRDDVSTRQYQSTITLDLHSHFSPSVALFAGVWGAGAETSKQWFAQGFRTLDDLRRRARLTRMQQIGLQYYDDFNTPIPRAEVTRIESIVTTGERIGKRRFSLSLSRCRSKKPHLI